MTRFLRSTRERALLAVAVLILAAVGVSELYGVAFAEPRDALAREERSLERELVRLGRVHERAEEIRARFDALPAAERESRESVASAGEILPRLEEVARGKVKLLEVQPDESAGDDRTARMSLGFEGTRGPVGEFLEGVIRDLGGQIQVLEASVDAEGTVRCQATVAFRGGAS